MNDKEIREVVDKIKNPVGDNHVHVEVLLDLATAYLNGELVKRDEVKIDEEKIHKWIFSILDICGLSLKTSTVFEIAKALSSSDIIKEK